jgi:hypothetical protein
LLLYLFALQGQLWVESGDRKDPSFRRSAAVARKNRLNQLTTAETAACPFNDEKQHRRATTARHDSYSWRSPILVPLAGSMQMTTRYDDRTERDQSYVVWFLQEVFNHVTVAGLPD